MGVSVTGLIDTPVKDIRALLLIDAALKAALDEAHSSTRGNLQEAIARLRKTAIDTSISTNLVIQKNFSFGEQTRTLTVIFTADIDGQHIGAENILHVSMGDDEEGRKVVERVTRALSLLGDGHVRSDILHVDEYRKLDPVSLAGLIADGSLSGRSLPDVLQVAEAGLLRTDRSIEDVLGMPMARAQELVDDLYNAGPTSDSYRAAIDRVESYCRDIAAPTVTASMA